VRQDFEAISPVTTVGADAMIVATGTRLSLRPEDIARLQLPDDQTPVRLQSVVCAVYATAP
jgi:hypothetical protein